MEFLNRQNHQTLFPPRRHTVIVFSLLAMAFALRFLYIFILHPPEYYIYSDMEGYYNRAFNIAHAMPQNIADTLSAPGTHFFYSLWFHFPQPFLMIKLVNLVISGLSCYFIYLITLELFNRRAAYIALFIAGINYLFIDFAGYILSETPFLFFFSLMFYLMIKGTRAAGVRRKSVYLFGAGFVGSLALAVRPGILIFLVLFVLWSLLHWKKQKIAPVLFLGLGYLPVYLLLVFNTYQLTGEWGFVATNGGLNFYQGRTHVMEINFHDEKRGISHSFGSPVADQKGYTFNKTFPFGAYESKKLIEEAIAEVKKDIPRTMAFSLEHVLDLFHTTIVWPSCCAGDGNEKVVKYFNIFFIYLIIVPAALPFFLRFRRIIFSSALLPYLAFGSNIAVVMIYYGDPRFRVPFDMFPIILTGYLLSLISVRRWKVRKIKAKGFSQPQAG